MALRIWPPRNARCRLRAVQRLVRRLRNHDEVILGGPTPADGRLPSTPTTVYSTAPIRTFLFDRVEAACGEQRLVRRVAEHDDLAPVVDLGRVKRNGRYSSLTKLSVAYSSVAPMMLSSFVRFAFVDRRGPARHPSRRARCPRSAPTAPASRWPCASSTVRFGRRSSRRNRARPPGSRR